MIGVNEINRNVQAAWALARRDASAAVHFDQGVYGFWRSFYAALVVLPASIIMEVLTNGFGTPPSFFGVLTQAISYSIEWTLFPLLMIMIADSMKVFPNYYRYITAANWAAVVQMAVMLPLAFVASVFPNPATFLLAQCAVILILVYRAYVAHICLKIRPALAAGVVFVDVGIAAVLHFVTMRIMGN